MLRCLGLLHPRRDLILDLEVGTQLFAGPNDGLHLHQVENASETKAHKATSHVET